MQIARPNNEIAFGEALRRVPEEWTALQLHTRPCGTGFVFTMAKMDDFSKDNVESEPGHGTTPAEAVLDALAKLKT